MSSVSAAYSQRVSKNFITTDSTTIFLESDFAEWLAQPKNKNYLSKVGNLYIVKGLRADFVLRGGDDGGIDLFGAGIDHSGTTVGSGVVLNDMGGDIRVYSDLSDDLVVFRRIQVPPSFLNGNNGSISPPTGTSLQVGYVLVEKNVLNMTKPSLQVTVARL